MSKRSLGEKGEEIAVRFLKKKRIKILERNFRTPYGEIDIIGTDGKKVRFIEVKTRSSEKFGKPFEAVNKSKLRHIKNSALFYLNGKDTDFEIDVISVLIDEKGNEKIEYIENVF
ncbi:MAG: YraN family protein [Caldisericaceae bacterium]|nr:YraN family protein [Caldisericaceae bacterium]